MKGLIESYHHSFFGILKPLNAALYASFTNEFYSKLRQGVIPLAPDDPQLRRFVDTVEKRYDYINKTAQSFGARFFLIWQPFWWVETGAVLPAVKQEEEVNLPKHMAVRQNFVVINRALADRLKNKRYSTDFRDFLVPRTQPVYKEDGIHLLTVGDEMVAGQMARYLKAQVAPTAARGGSLK
jgi:hypothetical protein